MRFQSSFCISARLELSEVWLMDRLSLIAPPENMETYNTKGFCTRKRWYTAKSEDAWIDFLARESFTIRWVISWWNIPRMVCAGSYPDVSISGLKSLTSYFPTRLSRQYGRRQSIPEKDTVKPADKPIVEESVQRWERYWVARPKLDVLDLGTNDWTVSKYYIIWMTSNSAARRTDARVAELKLMKGKRSQEDDFESNFGDLYSEDSRRTNTGLVKDRLGPRKAPVWERLEPVKELRIDFEGNKKKTKATSVLPGKDKGVINEKEKKARKKYVKKSGESSSVKKTEDVKKKEGEEE